MGLIYGSQPLLFPSLALANQMWISVCVERLIVLLDTSIMKSTVIGAVTVIEQEEG